MSINPSFDKFQKAYIADCFNLIRTISIKNSIYAEVINQALIDEYIDYPLQSDKRTWKYYLNLSGEYHHTDTIMEVTSLDSREPITFDKNTLKTHVATLEKYRYGSREYYSLINRYPENESLILGILYPCDIDKAIAAEDGTILSYDKRYIEQQEISILIDLEEYCKKFFARWLVVSYKSSDNLYIASTHAVLMMNLLPVLINARHKRCKTNEVHSFHLRQYLASIFELDKHYDYLNQRQRAYLYRNINRLSKYLGRNETFLELVENILDNRGVPLEGYRALQLDEFDSKYGPSVTYRRDSIIDKGIKDFYITYKKPMDFYNESLKENLWNPKEINENAEKINDLVRLSANNTYLTKNLISEMVDYGSVSYEKLNEVLLRELVYMTYTNRYSSYCEFKNPVNNISYQLSVKDCVIFLVYLAFRYSGIVLQETRGITVHGFLLDPYVSKSRLMSIASDRYLGKEAFIDYVLNRLPKDRVSYSVASFFDRGYRLYEESNHHWTLLSNIEDMDDRAEAQKIINALYGYAHFELTPSPENMLGWLSSRNLPLNIEQEDIEAFIMSVFTSVTGLNVDNSRYVPSIQKSLMELMKKLSSYSVMYTSSINNEPIIQGNKISTRHARPTAKGYSEHAENPIIEVFDLNGKTHEVFDGEEITKINLELDQYAKLPAYEFDHIVDTEVTVTTTEYIKHDAQFCGAHVYKEDGQFYSDDDPFIGYDIYKRLSQSQLASIPN